MISDSIDEILGKKDLIHQREDLALWMLGILARAPAFRYGAGYHLDLSEQQIIKDDVVAEFLICNQSGQMPAVNKILSAYSEDNATGALRCALWNRASQLVAQHFANLDPEWKHARRRIDLFMKMQGALIGLASFSAFGTHFLCLEVNTEQRSFPVIPREVLESRFAVPTECLKYGENLGEFILSILHELHSSQEFRPWLSVDDLAYLLAHAQERKSTEPWMQETQPAIPDATEHEIVAIFRSAETTIMNWFDDQYAPRKKYDSQIRLALRDALKDHVRILIEDTGNHPGLAALLCYYLPKLNSSLYHNSSLRSDFEYVIRRFFTELKKAAGPIVRD
jgi:hypothetical protein